MLCFLVGLVEFRAHQKSDDIRILAHRSQDSRVVILEYDVRGKILSTGVSYDNRLISVITIENRKIVHWRDYMDSLAAWTALNGNLVPTTPSGA